MSYANNRKVFVVTKFEKNDKPHIYIQRHELLEFAIFFKKKVKSVITKTWEINGNGESSSAVRASPPRPQARPYTLRRAELAKTDFS